MEKYESKIINPKDIKVSVETLWKDSEGEKNYEEGYKRINIVNIFHTVKVIGTYGKSDICQIDAYNIALKKLEQIIIDIYGLEK